MFKNARVVDKVYSLLYGDGVIVEIDTESEYPLIALFGTATLSFTFEGKQFSSHKHPSFFWPEPEIIAPPPPKRKTARRAYTKWAPILKSGINYDTLCDTAEEEACLSGGTLVDQHHFC